MTEAYDPQTSDLGRLYRTRFRGKGDYRRSVWAVLCHFLAKWIPQDSSILDLGCGHCEFINTIRCSTKFGIDLNSDAGKYADPEVAIIQQDCCEPWRIRPSSLDVIFTSNFFEHLTDKESLTKTLRNARATLKPGGRVICLGPNIKYVGGAYWDFFDHYLPLTELSLCEALTATGFEIEESIPRFLPYSMSHGRQHPVWMVGLYLRLPLAWRFLGKQFLIVARKT